MSDEALSVTVEGGDSDLSEETKRYIAERDAETQRLAAEAARLNQETAHHRAQNRDTIRGNLEQALASFDEQRRQALAARRDAKERGDYDAEERVEQTLLDINRLEGEWRQWHDTAQAHNNRPISSGDPIEDFISAQRIPQNTASFLRENRHVAGNVNRLMAAHHDALSQGLQFDSDQYVGHLKRQLSADSGDAVQSPRARQQAQASPRSGGRSVTLSQKQVENATDGTITWGAHDLRAGRIRDQSLIGQPIGTTEFARRLHSQRNDPNLQRQYDNGNVGL